MSHAEHPHLCRTRPHRMGPGVGAELGMDQVVVPGLIRRAVVARWQPYAVAGQAADNNWDSVADGGARTGHAQALGQGTDRVGDMFQRVGVDDGIECGIRKRQGMHVDLGIGAQAMARQGNEIVVQRAGRVQFQNAEASRLGRGTLV